MCVSRRDLIRLSAVAATTLAMPTVDTRAGEPMRLLILGGTGFIGPYQVRYALERGHHVTIFNRGRQKEEWPGHVEDWATATAISKLWKMATGTSASTIQRRCQSGCVTLPAC